MILDVFDLFKRVRNITQLTIIALRDRNITSICQPDQFLVESGEEIGFYTFGIRVHLHKIVEYL